VRPLPVNAPETARFGEYERRAFDFKLIVELISRGQPGRGIHAKPETWPDPNPVPVHRHVQQNVWPA